MRQSLILVASAAALLGCAGAPTKGVEATAPITISSGAPTAKEAEAPAKTLSVSSPPQPPPPSTRVFGAVSVDEYPVVDTSVVVMPTRDAASMHAYSARRKTIATRFDALRSREVQGRGDVWLAAAVAKLGYELVGGDLRSGGKSIRKGVGLSTLSVNQSGTDFALVVTEENTGRSFLVRKGAITPWEKVPSYLQWSEKRHGEQPPVFVGDDLLTVELTNNKDDVDFTLRKGKDVVLQKSLPHHLENPLYGLVSWDGHFAVETLGHVYVDGKDLNEEGGYSEVFSFQLVEGKPFFFFAKGGRFGASYGGEKLPLEYDDVLHGGCCEYSGLNPLQEASMIRFHARRDTIWYQVDLAFSAGR